MKLLSYKNKYILKYTLSNLIIYLLFVSIFLTSCNNSTTTSIEETETNIVESNVDEDEVTEVNELINENESTTIKKSTESVIQNDLYDLNVAYEVSEIRFDMTLPYATYSVINDGVAKLYKVDKNVAGYKNKTIAVNAGHGTKGGASFKTFSHPDFTPKLTGGTTDVGAVLSTAISNGTTLLDGTTEADANLYIAIRLKDKLLSSGYNVLMLREDDNARFDNIARTVLANKFADAHISIHFDSTSSDKGVFFITPYNDETYLSMEPLKSNVDNIRKLGKSIINAYRELGVKIWKDKGELQGDLTQISYSTNASVDVELGDKATTFTEEKINLFVDGIRIGIDNYFY